MTMYAPKRILIVRTDRIGDLVLSTPVIRNLRRAFPHAYIAFVCRPYTKEVLEGNPDLNELILYDKYGKERGICASIKLALSLRKKKFDCAFILHPTNRAHLITFIAGIPLRVGWDRKLGILLNKRVPHKKQEGKKHELEYTLDLLRFLDIPVKDKSTYFPIKEKEAERVKQLLSERGVVGSDPYIVVHPSASCPSKRWPERHFLRLIEILKKRTDIKIVVITAKGEEHFGESIVESGGVIDLRGFLSVGEAGCLLKGAVLFISNDSGPVHIAAALNRPVISIFGRKDPGLSPLRWRPLEKKSFYFHKDAGCKECLAHNCVKGFLCLEAVTPEEVAEKALAICKSSL